VPRNEHRIEAKVPVDLYELFDGYCEENGLTHSDGLRTLITRGLALDRDAPIDEAAFMAAYYNTQQRMVGALAKWLGPSGGFSAKLRSILRTAAAGTGVELQ